MNGSVLVTADWAVIAGYLGLVLAIGIFFARRGSSNTGGYFLAGRSLLRSLRRHRQLEPQLSQPVLAAFSTAVDLILSQRVHLSYR